MRRDDVLRTLRGFEKPPGFSSFMKRDPLLFLEDIEKSVEKVVQYTQGRSKDEVFEDDIRVDAG